MSFQISKFHEMPQFPKPPHSTVRAALGGNSTTFHDIHVTNPAKSPPPACFKRTIELRGSVSCTVQKQLVSCTSVNYSQYDLRRVVCFCGRRKGESCAPHTCASESTVQPTAGNAQARAHPARS
jgi:hypothetical protein